MYLIILIIVGLILLFLLIGTNLLKNLNILRKTFRRDYRSMSGFIKMNVRVNRIRRRGYNLIQLFEEKLKTKGDKVALYFEDEQWTFNDMDHFSNQIAHFFANRGFKKGDCIAIFLENCTEFIPLWFGLAKLGVSSALINTNLVGDSLYHCLMRPEGCRAIIFGESLSAAIGDCYPNYSNLKNMKLYQLNRNSSASTPILDSEDLRAALQTMPITRYESPEAILPTNTLLFIYTSGTTGLPKACPITHMRYMFVACSLSSMQNLNQSDILYTTLPLYHAAAAILGVGHLFSIGIPIALRKKFSATHFWSDCVKYKCTVAQYIGEICRYLLAAHDKSKPKIEHNIRLMAGNGLKPHIWKEFVDTFGIKDVFELYGSTEGNTNMCNIDSKPGAVGFVPFYLRTKLHISLVRCDQETGQPIRSPKGYCIRCAPGEPGLLIGRIDPNQAICEYIGYLDKDATSQKILTNVYAKGDAHFNSGDILVQDELGYMYFKDRTGDTYRWRGENVSTTEVEEAFASLIDFNDITVYGVELPGVEGRAGMAAIVDSDRNISIERISAGVASKLPKYAIPLFIRIVNSIPTTGTYKLKKLELRREGYDPNVVNDTIYFYDVSTAKYVLLTDELYKKIINREIRL